MKVLCLLTLFGVGCAAQVGDACETSTDCGRDLQCDLSQVDGYCTITPCIVNECPDEAVCVTFPDSQPYCVARCDGSDDCRDGYVCVKDYPQADAPFCGQAHFVER